LGYSDKLQDIRWQMRRLEILERDGNTCQNCGRASPFNEVHHKVYRAGNDPWDYDDNELVTLCRECHAEEPRNPNTDDRATIWKKYEARKHELLSQNVPWHILDNELRQYAAELGI
jgi:5-methylcytosine-specific restriction endonuclease McrA